jgi:predicted Zn-ribbon and HTH transcriptional regulator
VYSLAKYVCCRPAVRVSPYEQREIPNLQNSDDSSISTIDTARSQVSASENSESPDFISVGLIPRRPAEVPIRPEFLTVTDQKVAAAKVVQRAFMRRQVWKNSPVTLMKNAIKQADVVVDMRKVVLKNALNNTLECHISYDPIGYDDILNRSARITRCGHVFKTDSLASWTARSSQCPTCRGNISENSNNSNMRTDVSGTFVRQREAGNIFLFEEDVDGLNDEVAGYDGNMSENINIFVMQREILQYEEGLDGLNEDGVWGDGHISEGDNDDSSDETPRVRRGFRLFM